MRFESEMDRSFGFFWSTLFIFSIAQVVVITNSLSESLDSEGICEKDGVCEKKAIEKEDKAKYKIAGLSPNLAIFYLLSFPHRVRILRENERDLLIYIYIILIIIDTVNVF